MNELKTGSIHFLFIDKSTRKCFFDLSCDTYTSCICIKGVETKTVGTKKYLKKFKIFKPRVAGHLKCMHALRTSLGRTSPVLRSWRRLLCAISRITGCAPGWQQIAQRRATTSNRKSIGRRVAGTRRPTRVAAPGVQLRQ